MKPDAYTAADMARAVELLVEVERSFRQLVPVTELVSLLWRIRRFLVDLGVRLG